MWHMSSVWQVQIRMSRGVHNTGGAIYSYQLTVAKTKVAGGMQRHNIQGRMNGFRMAVSRKRVDRMG